MIVKSAGQGVCNTTFGKVVMQRRTDLQRVFLSRRLYDVSELDGRAPHRLASIRDWRSTSGQKPKSDDHYLRVAAGLRACLSWRWPARYRVLDGFLQASFIGEYDRNAKSSSICRGHFPGSKH